MSIQRGPKIINFLIANKNAIGGLMCFLASAIVTVTIPEIRYFFGLYEDQKSPDIIEPTNNSSAFIKHSENSDQKNIQVYTVQVNQPRYIQDAQTYLSVAFQNLYGQEFVTLYISPQGKKASVYAVLRGYTKEFKSLTGIYNVQILDIDYENKKVSVQVSHKS